MRWSRTIAAVTSISVGLSSLAYSAPILLATSRFATEAAGLDPVTALRRGARDAAGRGAPRPRRRRDRGDVELADSLLSLADARGIAVSPGTRAAVADLHAPLATTLRSLGEFGSGAWTGSADSLTGLAGVATADLLVIGDLRDIAGETAVWWQGGEPDWLIVGLATVGIGLTAGTVISGATTVASAGATAAMTGAAATARGGLSLIKATLKLPRVLARGGAKAAPGLRRIVAPLAAEAVDPATLKRAAAAFDVTDPSAAVRIARESVDWRRVGGLTAVATNLDRVRAAAGVRTALWLGRSVETPADLARGTRRLERLGGKALAVTARLGDRVLKSAFRLLGLVWDVVAALAGMLLGALHGLTSLVRGLFRLRRAFA